MTILPNITLSDRIQTTVDTINAIQFEANNEFVQNQILIAGAEQAQRSYPDCISPLAAESFGITQSINLGGRYFHLIVINEQLCQEKKVNLCAIILHEIGHIINHYGSKMTYIQGVQKGIPMQHMDKHNQDIMFNNEVYADHIAKKYGYANQLIDALTLSLNANYNDDEILKRIEKLKDENTYLSNNVKPHS